MLKIRRSCDHLSFNMGIPIPGKDCIYIEMVPRLLCLFFHMTSTSWCWAVSSVTLTHGSRIEGHFAKVHRVFVSRNNWSLPKVLVLQISPVSLGSLLWNTDDNIEMTLVICMYHYTPATKLGGVYWIHPVCLSVRLSVCLSVCLSVR